MKNFFLNTQAGNRQPRCCQLLGLLAVNYWICTLTHLAKSNNQNRLLDESHIHTEQNTTEYYSEQCLIIIMCIACHKQYMHRKETFNTTVPQLRVHWCTVEHWRVLRTSSSQLHNKLTWKHRDLPSPEDLFRIET